MRTSFSRSSFISNAFLFSKCFTRSFCSPSHFLFRGSLGIYPSAFGILGMNDSRRLYFASSSAFRPRTLAFRDVALTKLNPPSLPPVQIMFIFVVSINPIASSGPVTSYNLRLFVIFKISSLPTQTSPSLVRASESESSTIIFLARSIDLVLVSFV